VLFPVNALKLRGQQDHNAIIENNFLALVVINKKSLATLAIRKPEWQVCKVSHCGSKQQ